MALPLDMPAYRYCAWAGVGVLAAMAIGAASQGKGWGAAGLAAAAAAAALFILWRSRLPTLFSLLFVVSGVLNGLGWVFDFWDRVPYFDPVTHAYTTFAFTLALGFLAYFSMAAQFRSHGAIYVLSIASFGLALGGLWEIFEWAANVAQSYRSIAIDLIADTIGALLAGLLAAYAIRSDDLRIRRRG
jgi:VanZ family protein